MPDTKISNLPNYGSPGSNDLVPLVPYIGPGVYGSTCKVTVSNLVAAAPSATQPFCSMKLTSDLTRNSFYSGTAGGCSNNINWVVPFDSKIETASSIIEGNTTNMNMVIKTTGKYLVTGRVGIFDMHDNVAGNVYQAARLRLYRNSSPMVPSSGGGLTASNIESTLSLSFAAGTENPGYPWINGESTWSGTHIINVTSVPFYLQLGIFIFGGSASGGSAAYLIASTTTYGNQPEFVVQKISN